MPGTSGIDYDCASCGVRHLGADGTEENPWPLIDFVHPEPVLRMNRRQRRFRVRSTEELCLMDTGSEVDCFVRGILWIPVQGEEEAMLMYAPWVRISKDDYLELVDPPDEGAVRWEFEGTLANELPGCRGSLDLPVRLMVPGAVPPMIVPEQGEGHALWREEREGITRKEAELRVRSMLLEDAEL